MEKVYVDVSIPNLVSFGIMLGIWAVIIIGIRKFVLKPAA